MNKGHRKEFTIGLIALVSLFVLYFGIKYLKGINIFKPTNHYYVMMANVAELQPSGPVYIDGYKVGVVNHIDFLYGSTDPKHIRVQINLDKQVRLQTGTYAELKAGLTSGAYLDLAINKGATDYYKIGDTLDGISEIGLAEKLSTNVMPQVEAILPHLDSILQGLQLLISHPALRQSLDHIEASTANLKQSSAQLNVLLTQQVPPILTNLKKVSADFAVVSGNMKGIDLQPTLKKLDAAAANIDTLTTRLNRSDNSLGLLMRDRTLYDHIDSTAVNASNLLFDVKANPKRYVHFSIW
ncbi:mammalian cell entry protein [Bacteroidia bacterium]|nr:mammalian cell entry protein [Bacteroidia bacterium]